MTVSTTLDEPVVLNVRTGRSILIRLAFFAAWAAAGDVAFALGGWGNFALLYFPFLCAVGCLSQLAVATEWTVTGHELRRRRWLSRPGSKPSAAMSLGPEVEIVHESSGRWRVWPYGAAIDVEPWRTARLVGAMEQGGVRIDDWRGRWAHRHRLLNAAGIAAFVVGMVGIVVAIALVPLHPGNIAGGIAFGAAVAGLVVYIAMNLLPWQLSSPEAQRR